jgi:hypothetical protein
MARLAGRVEANAFDALNSRSKRASPQGEDLRRAEKAVEPVVVEMDIEAMAD